ncbi:ABC transporter permease [Streptomyces sp. NPDC014676]|uniref:ABC transporter permease n=1 Tax=Streptomyces sp. NPDC014676 TaxID=3364879 RepID=UPI00370294AA
MGAFVAVLGLTATASAQIDDRFDMLSATEVVVEDIAREQNEFVDLAFPADADARVGRLNGVEDAGVYWTVEPGEGDTLHSAPVARASSGRAVQVVAASAGALRAAGPTLSQGRTFDSWHGRNRQRVAVVRDWTPVLHPAVAAGAPAIGLGTGLFAGLYPAWRASRIQPVEALRR